MLSPQYNSKLKKETSFDITHLSPKKIITGIKDIKNIKVTQDNKNYKKKDKCSKMTINDFYIGKSLGQGRFGTAHMAFHKQSGAVFAIKKVKK